MSTTKTHREGLGLALDQLDDLAHLSDPMAEQPPLATGEPIEVEIDLIEEDPHQPRQEFGDLTGLINSIRSGGVRVPIAVRPHPDLEGHYRLNDGARRLRACKLAKLKTIPAVVLPPFTVIDQIVVNQERVDTPAKDKARAFKRLMDEHGWTQRQLAEQFGTDEKGRLIFSEAYISQHVSLLRLPEAIDQLWESDRCCDVTLINEVAKAYKDDPTAVDAWLADPDQDITRPSVKMLRAFIKEKKEKKERTGATPPQSGTEASDDRGLNDEAFDGPEIRHGEQTHNPDDSEPQKTKKGTAPSRPTNVRTNTQDTIRTPVLRMSHNGRSGRLSLTKRPSQEGFGWLDYDDGEHAEILLSELTIISLSDS